MRFSLQDVKKQVHRRSGVLSVSLQFLRPTELRPEIARLIAYYEQQVGQPQKNYQPDEARACVGDYRLANCLTAVLSAWYSWRSPAWNTALARLNLPQDQTLAHAQLEAAAITSPTHLRLALFDYVNAHHHGFLHAPNRLSTLRTFAELYALDVASLAYLLALDKDDEAILLRESSAPPTPDAVAALYNQWVFEAALFNASVVNITIDCRAFLALQQSRRADSETHQPLAGVGSVIKRLCFLARKFGVYYDLAYETSHPSTPDRDFLRLTLYGPQEMTGAPQQYGMRLARLCRLLMGYANHPSFAPKDTGNRRSRSSLLSAVREAEATVHFLQRSYSFVIDSRVLALLPADPSSPESPVAHNPTDERLPSPAASPQTVSTVFDSSIEQRFSEAFMALAHSQGADGWRLEREPEPLLLRPQPGAYVQQSIFIPDFALTRGNQRVYMEILGFWTPGYRERKVQKLRQLREQDASVSLILALPLEARPAFASLAADFPMVAYRDQLSATDLLQVLRTHFDDFAARMAQVDWQAALSELEASGFLPEQRCYELFHCYRRSELQRATARLASDRLIFTPGIGFYTAEWLERLHASFVHWVEAQRLAGTHLLSLLSVLQHMRIQWPQLVNCEDAALETLLDLWPEVRVQRDSIFDAILHLDASAENTGSQTGETEQEMALETIAHPSRATKKVLRERRPAVKKRAQIQTTTQKDLWE